jgi:2-C-methyl-D-erythritol 2,4-cyclodiphosphate synthase
MLGGAQVPAEFGEEAWSDGDVLLHAAIDALLGGAALGDIGSHFPPSDPRWKGADSRELAAHAVALVRKAGWEPLNLDCTVILEKPKLGPHREAIRSGLAAALGMELGSISVKAKTSEGVNAAGEGRAIEARAIVLLGRAEQA